MDEHFSHYPNVPVVATVEVSTHFHSEIVHSSGINNSEITEKVDHDLDAIAANTISGRVMHSAELATVAATGQQLIDMLNGKKEFPEAVTDAVKKIGTATAATAITAYLFS